MLCSTRFLSVCFLLVYCWSLTGASASRKRFTDPSGPGSHRGPRFLGLLGLLTGLTLVDSLDDDSDRPRRSGYVKIDVGRPTFDPFYGAYGYSGAVSPGYWPGSSSINIKIPFRPGASGGGDFETMALFPFPVPFPSGAHPGSPFPSLSSSVSSHGISAIEPRPSIFSDPIAQNTANGPTGNVQADEVDGNGRKQSKKSVAKRVRAKINPPRATRSTLRADGADTDEPEEENDAADTKPTEEIVIEDPPSQTEAINGMINDDATITVPDSTPTVTPSGGNNLAEPIAGTTLPNPPATVASIIQNTYYVTQATPPSYPSHEHSLADVASIDLTTGQPSGEEFQPSQADHWQNYYSNSVALGDRNDRHRDGFTPILPFTRSVQKGQ
ncbi:uncharacterized protein LOC126579025 [Anopheles aquasalis]|uniref:uncharacterized protein LOC126579025 n=1 Tax=Anopheles aquasalis TaxID=42839 RepID=UPI00215AB972|nr:uncharacterized protein LOC126579025 [Anopheles aquasalis]